MPVTDKTSILYYTVIDLIAPGAHDGSQIRLLTGALRMFHLYGGPR